MTKSEQKRIYDKWRKKQEALLIQASMDEYQLNTNVIQSADDTIRIWTTAAHDAAWGDCLSIMFHRESDQAGHWWPGHFSPARAKIFAYELLMRAEMIEKETGKVNIDKTNKMRFNK